ncbi:MAG: hypothetical protein H6508_00450 [Calditrichaeota bacterium]|nr:hypothetical protein [Calditrichota bacterium]MCB9365643.1 hypothetical protein [Calditrichota bacterium]
MPDLELYPIERILFVGPLEDVLPLAERARQAGQMPTLLLAPEEIEEAKQHTKIRILQEEEHASADDFDVAFECYTTDLSSKFEAMHYLEDVFSGETPIVTLTLTSALCDLLSDSIAPERVVGVSLLPPFNDTALAELMSMPSTDPAVLATIESLFESNGMKIARVGDAPAGVLVRTVCCLINEAYNALQEGVAPAADIDTAMQLGVNYPHGPIEWGNRIGTARVEAVMDALYNWFHEERYRATPLLRRAARMQ